MILLVFLIQIVLSGNRQWTLKEDRSNEFIIYSNGIVNSGVRGTARLVKRLEIGQNPSSYDDILTKEERRS